MGRQYVWTDEGLRAVERAGVTREEVTQALYAARDRRLERRIGDVLVVVMGLADTGRVIAVVCEHMVVPHDMYKIKAVGPLTGAALEEWWRRRES